MDLEGYDPREILPTELWFPILEHLTEHPNPRELIDAADTCTLFATILNDHVASHRLAEVMPLLLKWLGQRDRLNCRCVSKRVSVSVDSILDNLVRVAPNQHLGLFQSRWMPPRIPPSFEKDHFGSLTNSVKVCWDNQVHVERFNGEMTPGDLAGQHHHHPLVGSNLHLRRYMHRMGELPRNLTDSKNCLERSLQLLSDYKTAIRHLVLDTHCIGLTGNLIEAYDIRRRILTALPSLYCFCHLQWEDGGARVAEDVANLGQHIAQNPLPAMRYLEDISLLNIWNPPPVPLVQEICARYGRHLKRLATTQPTDAMQSGDTQALLTFPGLTHLKMKNCAFVDSGRNPPVMLMNVQAENLVDLCLGTIHMNASSVLLPEVVQYLASFPRLISLSLDMTYLLLDGQESRMILAGTRCPSLKELKVTTQHCQLPLAFFTALFPNLESFRLGGNLKDDKDLCYAEFLGDFGLLMAERGFECDVWGTCQSLKRFRFRCDHELDSVYTREDGNESRRQQHKRKSNARN